MEDILRSIVNEKSLKYIAEHYPSLRDLTNAPPEELLLIPGVGKSKANELTNLFRLSKQLLIPEERDSFSFSCPHDVYEHFKFISIFEEERVYAVYFDTKNRLISYAEIFKGTLRSAPMHPREFFRPGVRLGANSVIGIHNHPSGDPTPSKEDVEVSRQLEKAGSILGIPFLDHIIIGNNRYCSLKEKGLF